MDEEEREEGRREEEKQGGKDGQMDAWLDRHREVE